MLRSDFRKKGACSNCYKHALSEKGFGKWMHFQISLSLWELQVIRDWLCVRDIAETSLNRLLLLLILKSSHRSFSVEEGVLKIFTGKNLCYSLFLIKLRALRLATKVFSNAGVSHWHLRNFYELLLKNTCIFM